MTLIFKTLILFMLFSFNAHAIEAVIIVLETPLLHEKEMTSKVLSTRRKGDIIKIRDKDIVRDIYSPKLSFTVKDSYANEDFYETLDRNGNRAYILKEHVKLIYNDEREFDEKIKYQVDPTDYRLPEPLPLEYPLYSTERYRGSLAFSIGPGIFNSYQYASEHSVETFSTKKGLEFQYLKNVDFDKLDRLYFGGIFKYSFQENNYDLESGLKSFERYNNFQAGPFLTYDFYKNRNLTLSLGGGIYINYIKTKVRVSSLSDNNTDDRNFSGFQISPHLNTQLIYTLKNPKTDERRFAFFTAIDLEGFTPSTLQPTSEIEEGFEGLWNEDQDAISLDTSLNYSLNFGIKTYY